MDLPRFSGRAALTDSVWMSFRQPTATRRHPLPHRADVALFAVLWTGREPLCVRTLAA